MSTAAWQALATPRRREILRLVWRGELSAGAIHRSLREVTFGAVSQHLKVLADAGLVSVRQQGRQRLYRADQAAAGDLGPALEAMWDDALYSLKLKVELEEARRGPRPRGGARPAPRPRHGGRSA